MQHTETTFHNDLIVGDYVRYTTTGPDWAADGSGTYIGVALDEEDHVPYHYFVNGEINGHSQRCHGFPAAADVPVTTDLTPTNLILRALTESPVA